MVFHISQKEIIKNFDAYTRLQNKRQRWLAATSPPPSPRYFSNDESIRDWNNILISRFHVLVMCLCSKSLIFSNFQIWHKFRTFSENRKIRIFFPTFKRYVIWGDLHRSKIIGGERGGGETVSACLLFCKSVHFNDFNSNSIQF